MKSSLSLFALGLASLLSACDGSATDRAATAREPAYTVMGEDLAELKRDFNAHVGEVRLLFVVGPTCGICLRGMADLNDEFLAASQADPRLFSYVVHVPTLGAREEHVADSIPLLDGPRVRHYWEESGIIGSHYSDVLGIGQIYAWDVWLVYGPDVRWEATLPPKPAFWQHQLGALDDANKLDRRVFAAETRRWLERVAVAGLPAPQENLLADGTVIPTVAQPRGVAIQQYIVGRGGYRNLKRISAIAMTGTIEAGGERLPLEIEMERPDRIRRIVGTGERASIAEFDGEGIGHDGEHTERVLPGALEEGLLGSFEFDDALVEWKDKGHDVSMLGMEKTGEVLAWKLDLVQSNGTHRQLLIDSHTGHLVRQSYLAGDGDVEFTLRAGDFREVDGFAFPHRIEYLDTDGRLLATERITHIELELNRFDLAAEPVSH